MRLHDALLHLFETIQERTSATIKGLDAEALAWRPDADANSIAWLVWHLTRVEDSHVSEIAGRPQVWDQAWAERFGLPADYTDSGYGHSRDEVGQIRPDGTDPLQGYLDTVAAMVHEYLQGADAAEFDRIIDRSYDPPVTVGVRFLSVVGDAQQHLGQAAYVRGLYERQ